MKKPPVKINKLRHIRNKASSVASAHETIRTNQIVNCKPEYNIGIFANFFSPRESFLSDFLFEKLRANQNNFLKTNLVEIFFIANTCAALQEHLNKKKIRDIIICLEFHAKGVGDDNLLAAN